MDKEYIHKNNKKGEVILKHVTLSLLASAYLAPQPLAAQTQAISSPQSPLLDIEKQQNFIDDAGVDLATGKFKFDETLLSSASSDLLSVKLAIETPGPAIVPRHLSSDPPLSVSDSLGQILYSNFNITSGVVFTGTIDDRYFPPSFYIVQTPEGFEEFVEFGSMYSTRSSSSTLVRDTTGYSFASASGSLARYSNDYVNLSLYSSSQVGYIANPIKHFTKSNGERIDFFYDSVKLRYYSGNPFESSYRLRSAVSNHGYALQFSYESDAPQLTGGHEIDAWYSIKSIERYNKSKQACDEAAGRCLLDDKYTQIIKIVYDRKSNTVSVVKPNGELIDLTFSIEPTYGAYRLTSIVRGGDSSTRKSITYRENDVKYFQPGQMPAQVSFRQGVSLVEQNNSKWSYDYQVTSYTQEAHDPFATMTTTNPLGKTKTLNMDVEGAPPSTVIDELNRETSYKYKRYPWTSIIKDHDAYEVNSSLLPKESKPYLQSITLPEGTNANSAEGNYYITYDARGNITSIKRHGKAGSQVPTIEWKASYSEACSNNKTCNKPLTVTDLNGNITSYTYDETHGGTIKVESPSASVDGGGMISRVDRYNYMQQYAQEKSVSGNLIQDANPIWVLSSQKTCLLSKTVSDSCEAGADDQFSVKYIFGTSKISNTNNVFVIGKEEVGKSFIQRTCFSYDVFGNKIVETRPRAEMQSCI